jgi:hypothetical protein
MSKIGPFLGPVAKKLLSPLLKGKPWWISAQG